MRPAIDDPSDMGVAVAKVSPWSSAVWAAAAPALSPALTMRQRAINRSASRPFPGRREMGDMGRYGR